MSTQFQHNDTPRPPITSEGCQAIRNIFQRNDNIDAKLLKDIIVKVRAGDDENKIVKDLKVSKNKLYRYLCRWMVDNGKNIWVRVSPRKRGKNNYNKYNEKIQDIICGLEHCFNITSLCSDVSLSHQTMVKYLYRLMYLERDMIFG